MSQIKTISQSPHLDLISSKRSAKPQSLSQSEPQSTVKRFKPEHRLSQTLDLASPKQSAKLAGKIELASSQRLSTLASIVPRPLDLDQRLLNLSQNQLKFVSALKRSDETALQSLNRLEQQGVDIPSDDSALIKLGSIQRLHRDDETLNETFQRVMSDEGGIDDLHETISGLSDKEFKMLKAMRAPGESLKQTDLRLKGDDRGAIKPKDGVLETGIKSLSKRRDALTNPEIELNERDNISTKVSSDQDNSLKKLLRSEISELKTHISGCQKRRSMARARAQKHSGSQQGLERLLKKERLKPSPDTSRIRKMEKQLKSERRQLQAFNLQFELLDKDISRCQKLVDGKQAILTDVTRAC